MSGKASRSKGKRGEAAFRALLTSRDWTAIPGQGGADVEDALAIDPDGSVWAVEIKNTAASLPAHMEQSKEQARLRGKGVRWLLAWHIPQSSSWLVQRQGFRPCVWHQEGEVT